MHHIFSARRIGVALLIAAGWAQAQTPNGASGASPGVPSATAVNPVTQAAAQAGVRACLPRIDQFMQFLSSGGQTGVFLFTPPAQADQRLFSASMEVLIPGGQAYASSSFAPVGTEGCGALYETVSWWPNNCTEVARQAFPQLTSGNKLARNIQVLNGSETLRVFLMPAGAGCVSIKKEVVF